MPKKNRLIDWNIAADLASAGWLAGLGLYGAWRLSRHPSFWRDASTAFVVIASGAAALWLVWRGMGCVPGKTEGSKGEN